LECIASVLCWFPSTSHECNTAPAYVLGIYVVTQLQLEQSVKVVFMYINMVTNGSVA
jgi:hypothetical protein